MPALVCQECGAKHKVPDAYIGRQVKCIKCKAENVVSAPKPSPQLGFSRRQSLLIGLTGLLVGGVSGLFVGNALGSAGKQERPPVTAQEPVPKQQPVQAADRLHGEFDRVAAETKIAQLQGKLAECKTLSAQHEQEAQALKEEFRKVHAAKNPVREPSLREMRSEAVLAVGPPRDRAVVRGVAKKLDKRIRDYYQDWVDAKKAPVPFSLRYNTKWTLPLKDGSVLFIGKGRWMSLAEKEGRDVEYLYVTRLKEGRLATVGYDSTRTYPWPEDAD